MTETTNSQRRLEYSYYDDGSIMVGYVNNYPSMCGYLSYDKRFTITVLHVEGEKQGELMAVFRQKIK